MLSFKNTLNARISPSLREELETQAGEGAGRWSLTYEHSCLVSIDPQVQAFLLRLPDLCPQHQQAREDAPEPERGGRESASPGHAPPDLLAGGSRR